MARLEKDVIAGISGQTETNVIYPYFDAAFRQFVVGKDCILEGLELSEDGLSLSAGHCLCKGFEGELKNNIVFEIAPKKIYGQFIINHSKEKELDYFYIKTDPTAIKQDDILHEKGEYWLLLYEDRERKVDRDYPENAKYARNGDDITGTISPEAVITGDMKPLDTNDKTVATTEWAHKAVEVGIGYKKVEISYYKEDTLIGTLTLEKKADFVIATAHTISEKKIFPATDDFPIYYDINISIPQEFMPLNSKGVYIAIPLLYGYSGTVQGLLVVGDFVYEIQNNNTLKFIGVFDKASVSALSNISDEMKTFLHREVYSGWKINL